MEKAGKALGISRQRVGKLIQDHERLSGESVPRQPPILLSCARCGKEIGMLSLAALQSHSGYCRRCAVFVSPRAIPDETIEEWVSAIKGGASWGRLAIERGLSADAHHAVPVAVYRRLSRDERHEDIAQLWPKGVPAYLRKYDEPRVVRIPHLGKVS